MTLEMTSEALAERCRRDGEFGLAARYWTGGLVLHLGDRPPIGITMADGEVAADPPADGPGVITLRGGDELWGRMLRAVPPRFFNDVSAAVGMGLERGGDIMAWWQYVPAVQRVIELLRPLPDLDGAADDVQPPLLTAADAGATPRFDSPTGRYVHLELGGADHRIYYEEAGRGIPVLLQHTAGSHGTQWRHLFEYPEITDRFRLIAYDLPFHGKSVPPVTNEWWTEQYKLEGEFLRSVPTTLAAALELDRPVFMGCSVGGLLALDLALHHPDVFRAVISLEGALHIGGDWNGLLGFWHPQVGNDTKARMMEGLTAPTSPAPYRKETIQTYASGWPQAFLGDLWYYMVDYDLTDRASEIDTSRVGVHIFSGEYDYSGTIERGRAAHEAIAGSSFTEMAGMGHFPMSENPDAFVRYLLPALAGISDAETDPTRDRRSHPEPETASGAG